MADIVRPSWWSKLCDRWWYWRIWLVECIYIYYIYIYILYIYIYYLFTEIKDKMITVIIIIPVVPHKAVAEASKIETYRRGWLLWIRDGRAKPLMDQKVLEVSSLSLSFSDYLPTCLPIYLSLSFSLFHLSICLAVYLPICISIYLPIYLSICLPVYLWCSVIECNVA